MFVIFFEAMLRKLKIQPTIRCIRTIVSLYYIRLHFKDYYKFRIILFVVCKLVFGNFFFLVSKTGGVQGFKIRGGGAHLKLGATIFGLFRVKNHIFSNFRGGARRVLPPGSASGI